MRYQNRLMAQDEDNTDNTIVVDHSESSSRSTHDFFTLNNPVLIPSLLGSVGVLCVFLILFRSYAYRILIATFYGHGFYNRRGNGSRLKTVSRQQRQYYQMPSLSKP